MNKLKKWILAALEWLLNTLKELWDGEDEEPPTEPDKPELWDARLDQYGIYVERKPAGKYFVYAAWMTENGNWDTAPAWARRWQQDTLGGDHHVYGRVETAAGIPIHNTFVLDWPPYTDSGAGSAETGSDGWANLPMAGQNWNPATGPGPYLFWCFDGDRIYGLGMPLNHHVSFFVVWRPR